MNRRCSQGVSLVTLLVLISILGVFAAALMQLYVTSAQVSSERGERAQAESVAEAALAQASLGLRGGSKSQQDLCDDVTQTSLTLNGATGEIIESEWISGRCHVRARGITRTAERYVRGVLRGRGELLSDPGLWNVTDGSTEEVGEGFYTIAPEEDGLFSSAFWRFIFCTVFGLPCPDEAPQATLVSSNPQALFPTRYQDGDTLLPIEGGETLWFVADIALQDDESGTLFLELDAGNGDAVCLVDFDNQGVAPGADGCDGPDDGSIPDSLRGINVVVELSDVVSISELEEITLSVTTDAPSVTIQSPCLGRPSYCAAHTRPLEPWTWGYGTGE